ncbi:MAG: cupin domain-containing protein [Pseudomonadota bacterium]
MKDIFPKQIRNLLAFEGSFDAFKLTADSCSVLFASYPAGTTIEPHIHDTDNVGVITKGELILTINGETTHYVVGNWYHVPAQTEHSARFDQATAEIEFWFET